MLGVDTCDRNSDHLRSILLTGNCGNLAVEKRDDIGEGSNFLSLDLGSVKELKEAMTTSGIHKLDLQLTVTARGPGNSNDDQWIIPRLVFQSQIEN